MTYSVVVVAVAGVYSSVRDVSLTTPSPPLPPPPHLGGWVVRRLTRPVPATSHWVVCWLHSVSYSISLMTTVRTGQGVGWVGREDFGDWSYWWSVCVIGYVDGLSVLWLVVLMACLCCDWSSWLCDWLYWWSIFAVISCIDDLAMLYFQSEQGRDVISCIDGLTVLWLVVLMVYLCCDWLYWWSICAVIGHIDDLAVLYCQSEQGSDVIGRIDGLIQSVVSCLFPLPRLLPIAEQFDLLVLVRIFSFTDLQPQLNCL